MWKYSIVAVAVLALSACGQQPSEAPGGEEPPPTMPELTFTAVERDESNEVVMETTVEIDSDGSWRRTGTESDSGSLTEEQVERIDRLVHASDFPQDPDDDLECLTVLPPYHWSLTTGDDRVSNGNGGCVDSDSAVEIAEIVQRAADVGPTLEANR